MKNQLCIFVLILYVSINSITKINNVKLSLSLQDFTQTLEKNLKQSKLIKDKEDEYDLFSDIDFNFKEKEDKSKLNLTSILSKENKDENKKTIKIDDTLGDKSLKRRNNEVDDYSFTDDSEILGKESQINIKENSQKAINTPISKNINTSSNNFNTKIENKKITSIISTNNKKEERDKKLNNNVIENESQLKHNKPSSQSKNRILNLKQSEIKQEEEDEVKKLFSNFDPKKEHNKNKRKQLFNRINDITLKEEDVFNILSLFQDKELFSESPILAKNLVRKILNNPDYIKFSDKFSDYNKKLQLENNRKKNFFTDEKLLEESSLIKRAKYMKNSVSTQFFEDIFGFIGRKGFLTNIKEDEITYLWCIANSRVFCCYDANNTKEINIILRIYNLNIEYSLNSSCFSLDNQTFCSLNNKEADIWVETLKYLQQSVISDNDENN